MAERNEQTKAYKDSEPTCLRTDYSIACWYKWEILLYLLIIWVFSYIWISIFKWEISILKLKTHGLHVDSLNFEIQCE